MPTASGSHPHAVPAPDAELHRKRVRRQAKLRLAIFAGALIAIAAAVVGGGIIDLEPKELQKDLRGTGPLAPFLFVLISGFAGALFVPGPIFAVAGGLLFGPWLGILLGLAGAVVCAIVCHEIGSRFGRGAAEEIAGARLGQLATWLDRYGIVAVIAMRMLPAMPDAPLNYAAGLTRLSKWQIAAGTFVGSIPRTVGWGLVGATLGGGTGWYATVGGALIIGADGTGIVLAIFVARYLGIKPRTLIRRLRGATDEVSHTIATMRITIDGPAGAGKSTVARLVAHRLGFTYLDTGAMYRCAALAALRGSDAPGDVEIEFGDDGAVLLGGEDVSLLIRTPDVTSLASQVAAAPEVREGLVRRQQELMAEGEWVAEGRDVGSVVVPDAEVKIFLDADPLERAERRAAQLGADVKEVLRQQEERDHRDRTRADSPLVAADDAVHVDTTGLSIEDVVEQIVALAKERAAS